MAIAIFLFFVGLVLGLSFFFARKSKSASGYFAAGGQIHWAVNGIAFAGDYLSAASFLGICGMIATSGYDGFLYSIGYLAGWIVALFIVAEPMKRLGKYTFTDALDSKFDSKGIKLAAAISTLIVSICYLIPQMVGAGTLVEPLLGLPHWAGVIMVGAIVITIVATAGMTSTTYVQFLKGGLLIIFSTILTICVLFRGFTTEPDQGGKVPFYEYALTTQAELEADGATVSGTLEDGDHVFVKVEQDGVTNFWIQETTIDEDGSDVVMLQECQSVVTPPGLTADPIVNGVEGEELRQVSSIIALPEGVEENKPVGPFKFLAVLADDETSVQRWGKSSELTDGESTVVVHYPKPATPGPKLMRPGLKFKVEGTWIQRLDFVSLMLALFCGTAALPHILIRYYTVSSPAAARKSTIVAIAAIGFFYVLTMFMGLGAMIGSVVNPVDGNMSAPLLAQSFGEVLFAIISAIAFATVLGTVSGLIVASSGAIAHDLMDRFMKIPMDDKQKVFAGKASAFGIGIIAIILGIVFKGVNVSFLVGWAFAVAASANLPAIMMLLFWKKTTAQGITASIIVGIIASLGWILASPAMYSDLYGLDPELSMLPFSAPGIVAIPLSFMTLVIVSLMTQKPEAVAAKEETTESTEG